MPDIVLALAAALVLVSFALWLALALARRNRRKAREFLEHELGLKEVQPPQRLGRTQWFGGDLRGRHFVAGLISLSGPSYGAGSGRARRMHLSVVMPIAAPQGLASISHRGSYTKTEGDPFDGTFRMTKSGERPDEPIRDALTRFAESHGRINLWTRTRGALVLPAHIFGDAGHVLAWIVPVWPTRDEVMPVLADLVTLAETIDRS